MLVYQSKKILILLQLMLMSVTAITAGNVENNKRIVINR
jgi:hypothetical protein